MSFDHSQRADTVIVALPQGTSADWLRITEILNWHGWPAFVPLLTFPILRRRILGWISRWSDRNLLDVVRQRGAVTHSAGGRVSRLDLGQLATKARNDAGTRWWAWNNHIARTTPNARTWEDFLAEHERDPKKLPLDEAHRRFEAQPRVLAMLAFNSYPAAPHSLDPDELSAFQAGEAVYVALHWHHAVVGDAMVTPDGILLKPATTALADRLRYLADAARVIASLAPDQHVVAVKAATVT